MQTDYFELFPSYWAVNSRSVTCLQLLLGHSSVPGVPDAARRDVVEQQSPCFPWASWDASWLLSWVLALPYLLLVALEREAFALFCFWDTGMQRRWSSWAGEQAKEELGLRASPRGVTPVETCRCLSYLLRKSFQSSLVDCDRPSHKWHILHGILSAAGLQLWSFFSLNNLRELQKMQVQWKFYCPGLCNFYRVSSSQADNPIFSYLWLCSPCLTWIWSWCLCMCWLI